MAVIPIANEAARIRLADGTSFYVPQFKALVAGVTDPLPDIVKIVYKEDLEKFDSVTLTVNNWDGTHFRYKYIGSETQAELDGGEFAARHRLFEPCSKEVTIKMGYVGQNPVNGQGPPNPATDPLKTMLTGKFVAMSPTFTEEPPTLEVTALNGLFDLRKARHTQRYTKEKPSRIAKELGQNRSRFPLPIVISQPGLNAEEELETESQENEYDIDFLYKLARRLGYVIFVEEADGSHPRQLYFGPSSGRRPPEMRDDTFQFEWGKSLMEFRPTLSAAHVLGAVTVRGWRQQVYSCVQATVCLSELDCNADLIKLLGCSDRREEKIVRANITSEAAARERARHILLESLKEAVTAKVKIMGLPDLRAGRRVEIVGVGARLSGTYFVTETTHTIDDNGYITDFEARRENQCG